MRFYRFVIAGMFFVLLACTRQDNQVARFGSHVIDLDDFRLAYLEVLKQPQVFDTKELREKFLDELIDRELLADYAKSHGMLKDEKLHLLVDAYHDKCLREAHYKELIEPKVKIDENEVKEVFAYMKQKRKIRHLFAKTENEAANLYQQLRQGVPWKNLAEQVFTDRLMEKSGGELGWVNWDQLDYEMAMTAFRQKLHTYSQPVKSSYGYHIIMVDDYQIDLMQSGYDQKLHQRDSRLLLKNKIGERIASDYITNLMKSTRIKVRPRIMKLVATHLKSILHRTPSDLNIMSEMQLQPNEIEKMQESIWNYRNEAIAIINGKDMTVGQFLAALSYVPYSATYHSFKTALDYVIRDRVLTNTAKKMELENKYDFVGVKTSLYQDYQLEIRLKRDLISKVAVTKEEEQAKFRQMKKKSLKNTNYDEALPYVRKILLNEKQRDSVENLAQKLRRENPVQKNSAVIHHYYESLKR